MAQFDTLPAGFTVDGPQALVPAVPGEEEFADEEEGLFQPTGVTRPGPSALAPTPGTAPITPEEGLDVLPAGFSITGQEGVETSPIEQPPEVPLKGGGFRIPGAEPGTSIEIPVPQLEQPAVRPIIRRAAAAGVLFDKPAPAGQFLSSLAIDEAESVNAVKVALKRKAGKDVEVRMGPQTGALEFFDEESGRFSLVDPPGQFQGGGGGAGGPAIVITAEAMGAVPAAIFTKSPLLIDLGAGGGAFVGEIMRLKLGQRMGINKKASDGKIIGEALKMGGLSALSGFALRNAVKAGKFVIDTIEGRILPRRVADELQLNIEDAQKVADNINNTLGSERFRLTLAQATNDEDLLIMQDFFKRSQQFNAEFGAFSDAQQTALTEFNAIINRPYRTRLSSPEVGTVVQDVARSKIDRAVARQDVFVTMKEAELDTAVGSLLDKPFERIGPILRDVGDSERVDFVEWARGGARALNDIAGDKEFILNIETAKVVRSIDKKVSDALFPSVQKPQRQLVGAEAAGQETIPDAIRFLRETVSGEAGPETTAILNKVFDSNAKFTFSEAWEAISALKKVARVSSKGLSTDAPEIGAVKRLIKALETDLRKAAEGSPLRDEYQRFITRYAAEKRRLDEGTIATMMERRGGPNGRFVVANEDVFRGVFQPGGKREAEEVFNVIGSDPQAMTAMREGIVDFYKREVIEGGRVNIRKHIQFMRQYKQPLGVFFGKDEMKLIVRPGQIEKALQARERARERALVQINKTFDAEIANLNNPGKVVALIMDPKNPDKARAMMKLLENTPDVARGVRTEVRKAMAERVAGEFRNGERFFSAANFDKFLNGKSGEAGFASVLGNVFSKQYVKDLQTLNRALAIASREARHPNRSNTAFWTQTVKNLARAYVGLFTRPGRFITAIASIRGRASNRVFVNAMLNPRNARALMSLQGVDLRTQKAAALVGALGGGALLQDFE